MGLEIHEETRTIAGIPLLMCYTADPREAARRGTVLFYHGFTANKEVNRKELHSLAAHGFLAVGVDNVGHGARRLADFDERFASPQKDSWHEAFFQLVKDSVAEIPALLDQLEKEQYLLPKKLGICGISMGGFIAYGALLEDTRFEAAVTLVSSPAWCYSPKEKARFARYAILSQTAGRDEVIDDEEARQFHLSLAPLYADHPERNAFINYPHSPHMMLESDWHLAWDRTLQWFDRWLG